MNEHERLQALMKEENMNAKEFAEQVGISAATMSNIVNGRNNPSLDVMQKVLNRFRMVNSDWLILGVGSMYQEKSDSHEDKISLSLDDDIDTGVLNSGTDSVVVTSSTNKNSVPEKAGNKKNITVNEKVASKHISKIVVFYSDGTFEELIK